MEPISNKPLDSSLVNLGPTPEDQEVKTEQATAGAAPAPQALPFPDKIESSSTSPSLGGLILQEPPVSQLPGAPPDSAPPELASKIDTQLAMARLQGDARVTGEMATLPAEPPPPAPSSPTVEQASASVAAASTATGDAEDILSQMYQRAQDILDSGFTRADDILRFSEDAARQIESRGETESANILDTARQLAEQIRQRAYEEYQPPSIRPPLTEGGDQPPSIGLPGGEDEGTIGAGTSDWSDMLQDLFNKAMAEADDVWNRGQLDAARVLDGSKALAEQTRADGEQQASDVREAAIGASSRIHDFGRSISFNLREEGVKFSDMSRFQEDVQKQDIRDDEFRNTLQKQLRDLEALLAERGKLR